MFHTYVARVCSKCFSCLSYIAISVFMLQVASVFIWMLHMFHTHVASVCSKYFICMLHSSVFML
jgi:hypothetical protein